MPSVESVREFKVLTGTFSAEFGRGAGVVSVSTKSGNNECHGTAFEYLRNEAFDAKNFFALPTAKKAPLDRHQYGAQLSGPIIKNRTFFMADFAGLYENRGITTVNTVPTAATRAGDFSDYRDRSGNLIPIYDPLTTRPNPNGTGVVRDPFPGNVIPADRLNQVGLNVASIYPLPERARATSTTTPRPPTARSRDTPFTVRVDHRQGERDSFFVRYTLRQVQPRRPAGPGRVLPGRPRPRRRAASTSGRTWPASRTPASPRMGGAFNWTHIFGPSVVNELRLGFAKTNPETRQSDFGTQRRDEPGHPGDQRHRVHHGPAEPQHPGPHRDLGRPGVPAGQPQADPLPGRGHALLGERRATRFKGGYRFVLRQPSPFTNTDTRSSISINRNLTNNPPTNSQGSGIATLLLGYTTGGARGFLLEPYDMTNYEHSLFVQDDWKVDRPASPSTSACATTSSSPDTEKDDRLVNFDPRGARSSSTRARTGPTAA